MVQITYLGPRNYVRHGGMKFPRDVPVEVDDYATIGRLQLLRGFEISREVIVPAQEPTSRKGGWPKGKPRKAADHEIA